MTRHDQLPPAPNGWDVRPLKRAARINRATLADDTRDDFEFRYIDISSVASNGRIDLAESITFDKAPSRARRIVASGDTVISTVRTYLKAIGRITEDQEGAIASTGFAVLTPRPDVDPDYLWRFVQSDEFVGLVQANSVGVGYPSIAPSDLGALPIFVPPLDTQRAIASFLDRETAWIDTLIEKKRRLLDLLEEKRTALITRAVTRGLDLDVPFTDSGSPYVPQMPDHWHSVRLGKLCRDVADGPHFSPNYLPSGVPFLSARNVKPTYWSLHDVKFISEDDYSEFCKRVKPEVGDVLYTKGGTTGVARVVDLDYPFHVWVHIAVLKLKTDLVDPYYLAYALNGAAAYGQSQLFTRGATNNDLGLTRMVNIRFGLPPQGEQREIVEWLDAKVDEVDRLIDTAGKAEALLHEYRFAVISAAVIGRINIAEPRQIQPIGADV